MKNMRRLNFLNNVEILRCKIFKKLMSENVRTSILEEKTTCCIKLIAETPIIAIYLITSQKERGRIMRNMKLVSPKK